MGVDISISSKRPVDIANALKESKADIAINYLPVGGVKATENYANACLEAGVSFINAIPVFIASDPVWQKKSSQTGTCWFWVMI